ncbi:S9 family peptidase [Phytoactinopolyspora endophytica]|uniref:S9 family peptidase n=1 Tax=Phytoactinopolyspora endophytica TaxID=1642495 RepID=UPI00101D359A|nr:S9 family peptidase [Phytoactinopolyspora endophytica]
MRPLALDDLWDFAVPSSPAISPDGQRVVYVVRTADRDADRNRRALWTVPASSNAAPEQLTTGWADTSPAWSPDGERIAFVRVDDGSLGGDGSLSGPGGGGAGGRPGGAAQIWVLPMDDGGGVLPMGGDREPRRVTDLPLGAGAPVWSPDGRRIAFTASGSASGRQPDRGPVVVDRLGYKADGAGLRGDTRRHVHVLDLEDGEVRQITSGDWDASAPAWSLDGMRIAFTAAMDPDADLTLRSAAYIVDVPAVVGTSVRATGGDTFAVPRRIGPADGRLDSVVWAPDGSGLLAVGTPTVRIGHTCLLWIPMDGQDSDPTHDAAPSDDVPSHGDAVPYGDVAARGDAASHGGAALSGSVQMLDLAASLDRNVAPGGPEWAGGAPQFVGDGRTVVFCVNDRGAAHLYRVDLDGGKPEPLMADPDVSVSGLSTAPAPGVAAIVVRNGSSFGEIGLLNLDTGDVATLTALTSTALPDVAFIPTQEREFTIGDGTVVHGRIVRDPNAQGPQPLVLDAHGGPHMAWGPHMEPAHPYHQVLAGQGWTVLLLNPRASDGYGESFYAASPASWGIGDERDFLEPVDALVAEGIADPERLAICGYSYGGFTTCHLTTRTGRFAAAVTGGPVTDLVSMAGSSDLSRVFAMLEFGGDLYAGRELIRAQSPIERVEHVTTPTLVVHAMNDERCPVGQGEEWFTALRSLGVQTQMVLYPGESHQFMADGTPSCRIDYSRQIVRWVTEHASADE